MQHKQRVLLASQRSQPAPLGEDLTPAQRSFAQRPPWHHAIGLGSDRDVFPRPVAHFSPPRNRRWQRNGQVPVRNDPWNPRNDAEGARPWWWQPPLLGPFEMIVMLSVRRIGDCATGRWVHAELVRVTAQNWSRRAVYTTIQRLLVKGYLHSIPRPWDEHRGPHKLRHIALTALGRRALRRTGELYDELRRMPFILRLV